jgi:hypothetical protein
MLITTVQTITLPKPTLRNKFPFRFPLSPLLLGAIQSQGISKKYRVSAEELRSYSKKTRGGESTNNLQRVWLVLRLCRLGAVDGDSCVEDIDFNV